MALHLCDLLPLNPYTKSNHEKNIRQTQIEGHFTKYLTVKVIEKKESLRNYYNSEEANETWQANVICILDEILEEKKDIFP